jgi:hypothetical protein
MEKEKLLQYGMILLIMLLPTVSSQGTAIPTNETLLAQEIYYGALNFFSRILIPSITVIVVIFIVLFIFALASFIKKIGS